MSFFKSSIIISIIIHWCNRSNTDDAELLLVINKFCAAALTQVNDRSKSSEKSHCGNTVLQAEILLLKC